MFRAPRTIIAISLAATTVIASSSSVSGTPSQGAPSPKVFVFAASVAEAQPWIAALGLSRSVSIAGLSAKDPAAHCSADVCLATTGVGKANAAASVAAIVFSGAFDLSHTYFLVSSLAAVDPAHGTLGAVAWATSVVDGGVAWEVDARSLPSGWTTGYLGIEAMTPTDVPLGLFGTELFTLSGSLAGKAATLSKGASLMDDGAAQNCRAGYGAGPATAGPSVLQCDSLTDDTAWQGALLGAHATAWTALLTGRPDTYCMRQQQDNAAVAALERAAAAGLLDASRIAVLSGAASFDRPPPGQSAFDAVKACGTAGTQAATANLVQVGKALVGAVVSDWTHWQSGVPQ
jgi:purine nucleoside permease